MSGGFAERFTGLWGDRPVTSLRQVQALYGAISESEDPGETVIPEEFQLFVTPGALEGFTSEDEDGPKLVTVRVDLAEEPALEGVTVENARPDHVDRLGYSIYPWGRGIDHSITERGAKAGSSVSRTATYCAECLSRWTNAGGREPAVGALAEEHPDGWVIEQLATLGTTEGLEAELEEAIEREYGGGDRVIATVAVALDPEALEHEPTGQPRDGYYYPGQLHVLNAGMRARKEEKLARKNIADSSPPSRGQGVCMVTGEAAEVFGTTEDPFSLYTVQHAEKFHGLRKYESWRSHAVSADAALLVDAGASMVERFRSTRRGRGVYTIPYFTRMDAERARVLETVAEDTEVETQGDMAAVHRTVEADDPDLAADLRFYVLVIRNDSGDINVLSEIPDLTVLPAREVADAHRAVLDGTTFDRVAGFDQPADWGAISATVSRERLVELVVDGRYAYSTLTTPDEDAPAADDPADWLTFTLLSGDDVPVGRLLSEYVGRLAADRRDDEERRLPENQLKSQFAQLEALARAGRLTTDDPGLDALTRMPQTLDTDISAADREALEGAPPAEYRRYRLERFLEERPSLDPAESPARSAAFLAGVFVGQIGYYQADTRDMNRTALQQYPTEQMSGRRIDRFVPELVDKANAYAMEDEHSGASLFPELEDLLSETLTAVAGEWDIDTDDLRFHYALGQLFGKRADYRAYELRQQIESDATPETDD